MALQDINFANRRSHRSRVSHPAFIPRSPQVQATGQVTTPTAGATVAIRPPRTAIRYMRGNGAGEVAYV